MGNGEYRGRCRACDDAQAYFHRRRIFVGSNCDWLDPNVPVEMLAHMLDVIRRCDQCEIVLLTKRPGNFDRALRAVFFSVSKIGQDVRGFADAWRMHSQVPSAVPAHVTIGVSVTDQATADKRIPELLRIPAAKRIVSAEPLIGPINLGLEGNQIHLVIVGGMSGPKWIKHHMKMNWLEHIVNQCDAANVPVWVKQDSGPRPGMQGRIPSELWKRKEWPV